jgi:hypothetical protein
MGFTWHEIQATCQRGKAESLSSNKNPTTNQNLLAWTLRPSSAGLRMWPHKSIFHIQASYFLCSNPAHKTETGTANRWGTTNSKPHGPIIMMGQSKTLSSSQMMFIILVHTITKPFTSQNLYNYSKPKQFFWAKRACFKFFSSNFTVHDHILSTAGDALRSCAQKKLPFITWVHFTWEISAHIFTIQRLESIGMDHRSLAFTKHTWNHIPCSKDVKCTMKKNHSIFSICTRCIRLKNKSFVIIV